MTTRFALTEQGEKARAADDMRRYVDPKIVAEHAGRPLNEVHDAIYNNQVSWAIDRYGNVGIDREEIPRLRNTNGLR